MKHNKLLKALLVVCSLATASFAVAGCDMLTKSSSSEDSTDVTSSSAQSSTPESAVYEFEGLSDVKLALSADSYDFTNGVKAYKNFEESTFTVDSTAVNFGTAGQYVVKYKVDDHEETRKVFVYGQPTFTETNATITYQDVQTSAGIAKAVSAKDSFGTALQVTVTQGVQANTFGYVEYGTHSVSFSATDSVGNTATYTCNIVVSDADKPSFENIGIDLVDIYKVTEFDGVQISKIIYDGVELTAEDYSFINGYLSFTEDFIVSKDLGTYDLLVVTNAGYDEVQLTLTDAEDAKYSLKVSDMEYANTLSFNKAVLQSHQKNITFEYVLETADGEAVTLTDAETAYTFVPGLETSFTLTVTAKRGAENAGVKEYPFSVQDDVYMWMVNRANDKDATNFVLNDAEYDYGYTTEQSYNGLGTLKAEALSGGCIRYALKGVANVSRSAKLYFYVYNPTGIALQAYIYTASGYWTAAMLQGTMDGVLTNMATISAETGWQKVELQLLPAFDGTLGNMWEVTQTELRICNPDGWLWEGEGKFGVYTSNVYLETVHGMEGVTYNEATHQSTGVATLPMELASASSTDGRYTFQYEVKKGETVLKTSNEEFSFTPDEAGEYTYTITSYWRGMQVGTKSYTLNVSGRLALVANPYYQYDEATGNVILPAATCAIQDATLVYTVTNPANETVTLDDTFVYDTDKVNGTYTYKVVAKVDGEEVESDEKQIAIHSANVLVANGCGENAFTGNITNMNVGTLHTYCEEESAPGEIGSLKLDNTNRGEKGNFNLQLVDTNIIGKSMITFYIKHTGSQPLDINMYGTYNGAPQFSINFWVNGTRYTTWDNFPISGSNEWQRVDVLVTNPDGFPVGGSDIRLNFMSQGYAWGEGEAPVIYLSNIYYDLPTEEPDTPVDPEPETPVLPEGVLVANGCGEELFNGDKLNGVLGLTATYCAEESAPGEEGSAKLDNSAWSEKGNFALTLNTYDLAGKSVITFYIKSTSAKAMQCKVYSGGTGNYINYWFNGQQYVEDWESYPITGEGWIKVDVSLSNQVGTHVSGDVWLFFVTENYAWDEGSAPVIYMSNIYYDLVAEPEPDPEPEIPEDVLVYAAGSQAFADGGMENFGGIQTLTYTTEMHEEGQPGSVYSNSSQLTQWADAMWTAWVWVKNGEYAGTSMVKFTFYYNGADPLNVQFGKFANGTWWTPMYSDFIYNGVRYTSTSDFVIEGKDAWQEVYFVTANKDLGADAPTRVQFSAWNGEAGTDSKGYLEMWFGNVYDVSDVDIDSLLKEEESTVPANVLVANGCGEELFNGNVLNMNNGTTYTYCAEESAPNEVGCLKVDTTNHNNEEKGNFSFWLADTDIVGKSMLTFYIKHTGSKPLDISFYSTNSGNNVHYWYNGTKYETWDNFPIEGKDEWQKVEVILASPTGTPIGGAQIQMTIASQGYAWGEGEAPVIYISNIYFS